MRFIVLMKLIVFNDYMIVFQEDVFLSNPRLNRKGRMVLK